MLTLHTRIALLTLLPVLLWASLRFVERQQAEMIKAEPVQIGIEHEGPAIVTLTQSRNRQPQFIDITNEGTDAIRISVPAVWERGEVRGAPLASLIADEPMFGYRRWHVPQGATISFRSPLPWTGMTVHNPSGLPLRLRRVTVDLDSDQVTREVYLLSDQSLTLQ